MHRGVLDTFYLMPRGIVFGIVLSTLGWCLIVL